MISLNIIEPYNFLSSYLSYQYVQKLLRIMNDNHVSKLYNNLIHI